jgi:hypothetical protein
MGWFADLLKRITGTKDGVVSTPNYTTKECVVCDKRFRPRDSRQVTCGWSYCRSKRHAYTNRVRYSTIKSNVKEMEN